MLFIHNFEDLVPYIPNYVAPAPGDRNLFEEILPYLETAECEAVTNLLGNADIRSLPNSDMLYRHIRNIVAMSAIRDAIPALDLVLTPSGIGVVSTETIAPASRERTANFLHSLDLSIMRSTEFAVRILTTSEKWRRSSAGRWWLSSLFPVPSYSLYAIPKKPESMVGFFEYRGRAISTADLLAGECLSTPVLLYLLDHQCDEGLPRDVELILTEARHLVASHIDGKPVTCEQKMRLADLCERSETLGALWKHSRTGQSFLLDTFENSRDSGGFFF